MTSAVFREEVELLSDHCRRQARHTHHEDISVHLDPCISLQGCGWAAKLVSKGRGVQGRRALDRQAEDELSFFGNALLAAHQPLRLQLHVQRVLEERRLEIGCDRQWHGQQHRVRHTRSWPGSRPGYFRGMRPRDCRRPPPQRGKRPLQARVGQAGIARVLPVRVPIRLVGQLQADPQWLAGLQAVGCVGHQFCARALRSDYVLGIRLRVHRDPQKHTDREDEAAERQEDGERAHA
jgi:hypothetical protein